MAWNSMGQRAVTLWLQSGSSGLMGQGFLSIWLEMLLLWMLIVVGLRSNGVFEV
jgi:hypothetical protein